MVSPGDAAPSFALPAVVDGEVAVVDLEARLGEQVVILAFYPGDFNPACSEASTGLDDLALFTMQKDVSILAVSGDSVHSHRAFARKYDLSVPLLADVTGEVSASYGLRVADSEAGYLTRRGVVVIGPEGEVAFTWEAEDPERLPDTVTVRSAVEDVGSEDTARARYRVGHAHYVEGRRAFTSAMDAFDDREWMLAQTDFSQAHEEFAAAQDCFNTASRFAGADRAVTAYEDAEEKAGALWRATDWLAEASSAFASGEGARGEQLRHDAETPLETARELPDPPEPDEFPFDAEPPTGEGDDGTPRSAEGDGPDASLGVDIDAAAGDTDRPTGDAEQAGHTTDPDAAAAGSTADSRSDAARAAAEGGSDADAEGGSDADAEGGSDAAAGGGPDAEAGGRPDAKAEDGSDAAAGSGPDAEAEDGSDAAADEIDEAELDEITAELEAQTERAEEREGRDSVVPDEAPVPAGEESETDEGAGTE